MSAPIEERTRLHLRIKGRVQGVGFRFSAHDEARQLGLKVGTWTVNDPDKMRWLSSLFIDAIYTDRPDLLSAIRE